METSNRKRCTLKLRLQNNFHGIWGPEKICNVQQFDFNTFKKNFVDIVLDVSTSILHITKNNFSLNTL